MGKKSHREESLVDDDVDWINYKESDQFIALSQVYLLKMQVTSIRQG